MVELAPKLVETISFCALILLSFLCSEVQLEKAVFDGEPVIVQTYENDTVLLPCYVTGNEGPVRVRWYKQDALLGDTSDPHHLLPPRLRILTNYTLQIDQLMKEDTASYTCEIIRPEPWGLIRQMHVVNVKYAPKIRIKPEDGFIEVKKGDYVDIACEVDGLPPPTIDWKKNGETMQLLEHRSRIRFKAEHRHLGGVYECVAGNGVGDPAVASVTVVVLDAPSATPLGSGAVHAAPGLRAVLAARVQAAPPARALWRRGPFPVHYDQRVIQMVEDGVYQLIFRKVLISDFGNYTFRVENKLGMADVTFRLTGVPKVASFKVDPALNRATPTSFTLIWEVDSYSTIIEYNLWLRQYRGQPAEFDPLTETPTNRWSKIVVPGDATDGPIHSASYTVRGLTPSTVYEAIVTSRNRFGWSKTSSILHFATDESVYGKPATIDYSEGPTLEDIEDIELERNNSSQARILEHSPVTDAGNRRTPFWNLRMATVVCFYWIVLRVR